MTFDRLGQPLLTCYTGDRQHQVHIDNPHNEEGTLPDNGMRRLAALASAWLRDCKKLGQQGTLDYSQWQPSLSICLFHPDARACQLQPALNQGLSCTYYINPHWDPDEGEQAWRAFDVAFLGHRCTPSHCPI